MRRVNYAANKERINAQKRAAYAARKLNDIEIGRSIGAKAKNYVVVDKSTGEEYYFIEEPACRMRRFLPEKAE